MHALLECGHSESAHSSITVGYGTNSKGERHCYMCCAEQDKATMRADKRIVLYLDTKARTVSNWPGSFKLDVSHISEGRHNIAGKRYDAYFMFEGTRWHGVQYGDMTQLVHCKQLKG